MFAYFEFRIQTMVNSKCINFQFVSIIIILTVSKQCFLFLDNITLKSMVFTCRGKHNFSQTLISQYQIWHKCSISKYNILKLSFQITDQVLLEHLILPSDYDFWCLLWLDISTLSTRSKAPTEAPPASVSLAPPLAPPSLSPDVVSLPVCSCILPVPAPSYFCQQRTGWRL